MLTVGAELFAEHAGGVGRRLGVTALAVGLVLAGAEPEELVTALFASLRHHPGIAGGDAVGANVTMLTLVVGLAAVFRPLPSGPRIRGYALVAAGAGTAAAVMLLHGQVGRIEGGSLVVLYLGLAVDIEVGSTSDVHAAVTYTVTKLSSVLKSAGLTGCPVTVVDVRWLGST